MTTGKVNMSIVKVESASTSMQSLTHSSGAPCMGVSNTSLGRETIATPVICLTDEENVNQSYLLLIDEDEKMPLLTSQCDQDEYPPPVDTSNPSSGDEVAVTCRSTFFQTEHDENIDLSAYMKQNDGHEASCVVIALTLTLTIAMSLAAYVLSLWFILYVWIEIMWNSPTAPWESTFQSKGTENKNATWTTQSSKRQLEPAAKGSPQELRTVCWREEKKRNDEDLWQRYYNKSTRGHPAHLLRAIRERQRWSYGKWWRKSTPARMRPSLSLILPSTRFPSESGYITFDEMLPSGHYSSETSGHRSIRWWIGWWRSNSWCNTEKKFLTWRANSLLWAWSFTSHGWVDYSLRTWRWVPRSQSESDRTSKWSCIGQIEHWIQPTLRPKCHPLRRHNDASRVSDQKGYHEEIINLRWFL